ncbi:hypothetical protein E2651_42685 [Streptomyces sp. MZ04]|nr:hypothetical protein E2651_42685 [Streptomyces sp. MZ04]
MQECPRCGGEAAPDPEHQRSLWCLACWHSWPMPEDTRCPGLLPRLAPGLRLLGESRHLRR